MLKNKLITPEGTRDLLFEDCTARRQVEAHIKELLLKITESPRRRCTN